MKNLVSARIFFFSLASGADNILELCMHFYSHSYCMTDFFFFFNVKALQEIIFSNLRSHPLKDQMVHP